MTGPGDSLAVYGTNQPAHAGRYVQRGNLSFVLEAESIRRVSWHGVEVVRGISWPIRDENWGTFSQQDVQLSEDGSGDDFSVSIRFAVGDTLDCHLTIRAPEPAKLRTEISMTARRDFATNRAGFTILHPLFGVSGAPLELRHSDGRIEQSVFPELVRPDQPAKDVVGMAHEIAGVRVELSFEGEIFEMEDQRNWTDASFKTYCRPLVYPFTYVIAEGETVTQAVELTVSGTPATTATTDESRAILLEDSDRAFPAMAVALERGWVGSEHVNGLIKASGVRLIQARSGPQLDGALLSSIAELAELLGAEVDIEVVLGADSDIEEQLRHAATAFDNAGIKPARIIALPEDYLASHQPSGPWPDGATPLDAAVAARRVFPKLEVGGGVLTNFTEFNRCRPQPDSVDYVTHGTTAIVHASDDHSVIDTLEALPQVFASAVALSGGKPYRLGLVAIGMRSNPYGADVAANPQGIRRTMARNDPRHCGLFGAAWAVGAIAAAAQSGVSAMSLGAPAGPFSFFNEGPASEPVPLYHVFRFAAGLSGQSVCRLSQLPIGVYGFAASASGVASIAVSNLSGEQVTVQLPKGSMSYRVLDMSTNDDARGSAHWLIESPASEGLEVSLEPFAIAFVEAET